MRLICLLTTVGLLGLGAAPATALPPDTSGIEILYSPGQTSYQPQRSASPTLQILGNGKHTVAYKQGGKRTFKLTIIGRKFPTSGKCRSRDVIKVKFNGKVIGKDTTKWAETVPCVALNGSATRPVNFTNAKIDRKLVPLTFYDTVQVQLPNGKVVSAKPLVIKV
ncbi:MAG: hypothetical protein LBG70_00945, partial [Bifidobacteriaceae bacterium]|nr:hypothetical protein [Bifidobacteriaceae bacterium]